MGNRVLWVGIGLAVLIGVAFLFLGRATTAPTSGQGGDERLSPGKTTESATTGRPSNEGARTDAAAASAKGADASAAPGANPTETVTTVATDTTVAAAKAAAKAKARAEERAEAEEADAGLANTPPEEPSEKVLRRAEARLARDQAVFQTYGDLFAKLNLTPEESDRLGKMLLLKPRIQGRAEGGEEPANVVVPAGMKQPLSSNQVLENSILDLLGKDRYAVYQQYEATLPDRWVVTQYKGDLGALGKTLSKDQESQLLTIVTEERQKLPSVSADSAVKNLTAIPDQMAVNVDKTAESNRVILARAQTLLDPGQFESFKALLERNLAQDRKSVDAYRQLFQNGGATAPKTPAPQEK
ncbi:MAG: hypothetical protein A3K19_30885 [Lentisphaerae bacterium RIFOXYB12_FULL_65_16]|nr:MAG: hypothetical protein A3K18_04010 [Lentisphaerae bacterium RIFOXYA12_64_32]OGV88824.1 MAG: hypothetical protein A3K19_30885 [Lentisphaerae bacterium RIFOXYB12_FULL_65_16]